MQAINIEDLRSRARRRLPKVIFEFIDGGAQDETTLRANREDFQKWRFSTRVRKRHFWKSSRLARSVVSSWAPPSMNSKITFGRRRRARLRRSSILMACMDCFAEGGKIWRFDRVLVPR